MPSRRMLEKLDPSFPFAACATEIAMVSAYCSHALQSGSTYLDQTKLASSSSRWQTTHQLAA